MCIISKFSLNRFSNFRSVEAHFGWHVEDDSRHKRKDHRHGYQPHWKWKGNQRDKKKPLFLIPTHTSTDTKPIPHQYSADIFTDTLPIPSLVLFSYFTDTPPIYSSHPTYLPHTSPNFTWSCLKSNKLFLKYKMRMNNVEFSFNSLLASVALLSPRFSSPI